MELKKTVAANGNMTPVYEQMRELEMFLEPLIAQSDAWVFSSTTTSPVDPSEEVVARGLKCIARVKLNR